MPSGLGGYQPDTRTASARRADFDLRRKIATIEEAGGVPGPPGPPGEQGPPGADGAGTDEVWIGPTPPVDTAIELWFDSDAPGAAGTGEQAFVFQQATPSAVWTIVHPLTFLPNVTITDSAGDQVEGTIKYVSITTIQATFSSPFAGVAYLS